MEMLPFISQATTTYTNATGILQSWRVLLGAARSGDVDSRLGPFRYDFTDLTRQVITNLFADVTAVMQAAYTRSISGSNPKAGSTVKNAVALGKQLYASMDTLLSTNVNYLLGERFAFRFVKPWVNRGPCREMGVCGPLNCSQQRRAIKQGL